jgi:N-acetyl sugar amidotransferase
MKYCTVCLQTDTRPNTYFNASGLCPACVYFNELQHVDWEERFEILQELITKYAKKTSKQKFDCIIGVSGGKDSTRQALWARDKLGLNPLLVCLTYPPEHVTTRGVDNLSNLIQLGFNVVVSALSPVTWRRLMRHSFDQFTNFARSTELALFASVPRIAIRYQIPLILWGENPGLQLGDMKTLGKTGYDGNNLRNMNTLNGGGLEWMLEAGLDLDSLISYQYPSKEEFDDAKLQIVYLGWFLKDWSLINNALYSCASGLEIRTDGPDLTGDFEGVSSLDEDWVTLNQMIKYYKYGFGRATDYVNEAVRHGRLTRDEGIECVEQYDGRCGDDYIAGFCDYIGISVQAFWDKVYQSTNLELFDISNGVIKPKFKVGVGL